MSLLQAKPLLSSNLVLRPLAVGLALLLLASSLSISLFSTHAQAADADSWSAGRIIDDSVFTNSGSMTTSEIREFLDDKVPDCDTNGDEIYSGSTTRAEYGTSRGNPPPYTCLKDYEVNGNDAAEIIKDAAEDYRISPRTIIVLLQKEQGLVTDEWPWRNQYRYATGYCVTDSGLCGDYWTFTKQVRNAAALFRRIIDDPSSSNYPPGSRRILYNPNADCGRKTVLIENAATSALYHYTPYTPNQAALNNMYGTGDSCSAYGNRNFWRYFIDWFGSTRGDFRLIECNGNKYMVEKSIARKRQITEAGLAAWGLEDTYFKPNDSGCSYDSYSVDLDVFALSRSSGYKYFVDRRNGYKISSQSIANAWDFGDLDDIDMPQVNSTTLKSLELPGVLTRSAQSANTSRVYFLNNGALHQASGTPDDTDSARLMSGSTEARIVSSSHLIDLKDENGEGDSINYAFQANGDWYVFDYGKIRKIHPDYYDGRWENLESLTGPTLANSLPSALDSATSLKKGFRRGSRYFRITVRGTVQSTTSLSTARSWDVDEAPVISSLLANKIVP